MPKLYSQGLPPDLAHWALSQPVFFISTAPSLGTHINLSPKGLSSLSFLALSPVAVLSYVDHTGSGVETLAHLYDNGRATIMFCSFGPAPRILRFYCRMTRVVESGDEGFEEEVRAVQRMRGRNWLVPDEPGEGGENCKRGNGVSDGRGEEPQSRTYPVPFPTDTSVSSVVPPGARAVITFIAFKIQTSCGYGVPQIKPELYAYSLSPPPTSSSSSPAASCAASSSLSFTSSPLSPPSSAGTPTAPKTQTGTEANPHVLLYPHLPPGTESSQHMKPTELSCFAQRPTLAAHSEKLQRKSPRGLEDYQVANNDRSLDGLPGLKRARRSKGESVWLGDLRWRVRKAVRMQGSGFLLGFLLALVLVLAGWMGGLVKLDFDVRDKKFAWFDGLRREVEKEDGYVLTAAENLKRLWRDW